MGLVLNLAEKSKIMFFGMKKKSCLSVFTSNKQFKLKSIIAFKFSNIALHIDTYLEQNSLTFFCYLY